MKKTLLSLFIAASSALQLNAQCTITPGCTTGPMGYCTTPAEDTNLPGANVSSTYSTVIQISTSSTVSAPGVGVVTVNSVSLTSITGLPTGLTYSMNPGSRVINGGSSACILIAGTPGAGTAGNYTVTANADISTSVINQSASIKWFLTVGAATGIKSEPSINETVFIAPNPASAELSVSASFHFGKVQVLDALGKVVLWHDANYTTQTTLNISTLSKGVYFLQANDGNKIVTKKFIKD